MTRTCAPLEDRFWSKVDRRGQRECWPWTGSTKSCPYGRFRRGRSGSRSDHPMRVAWELTHGAPPPGVHVCHRCDNPPCCNPSHLFLGTTQANTADKVSKGRQVRGSRHGRSKMTEVDVIRLRHEWSQNPCDQRALARKYGVSQATAWRILQRHTWRHV